MKSPHDIKIEDYTYQLPDNRIARYPLEERDSSQLLIYKDGHIQKDIYHNIASYLPEESLLIFNNTKVVEARLVFQKESGGYIEVFCLEPDEQYKDITSAMLQTGKVRWKCLVGGASKWKAGQLLTKRITTGNKEIALQASFVSKSTADFIIELSWQPTDMSFAEILHLTGAIPLPPYLKRLPEEADKDRYQTVYAAADGSVAAPTAGLHFTNLLFSNLRQKNIFADYVTLHVGAGTFKPVKAPTIGEHEMHAEWIDVPLSLIEKIVKHLDKKTIAVGTTSLRTLESLYWMGVKSKRPEITDTVALQLGQWEAYKDAEKEMDTESALNALINWMKKNNLDRLVTKTQILIAPGYHFKMIDGLVTNFHQPQSTLLLLVAALIGDDWKKVYEYALDHDFRFLSYGDGSLLWKKTS